MVMCGWLPLPRVMLSSLVRAAAVPTVVARHHVTGRGTAFVWWTFGLSAF